MPDFNRSRRCALPGRDIVLQFGRALQGERDALFRELDHLDVGLASGGPALYVGGLSPPAVSFVVMEDSYGFCHFRQSQG